MSTRSASSSDLPTSRPARLEERVGHAAADQQLVDPLKHALQHAQLGGDLRAADDRDERPLRVLQDAAEDVELLLHQEAGRRRQVASRCPAVEACARWAAPNASLTYRSPSEASCLRERRVVLLFLGVEADVLQQQHVARLRAP